MSRSRVLLLLSLLCASAVASARPGGGSSFRSSSSSHSSSHSYSSGSHGGYGGTYSNSYSSSDGDLDPATLDAIFSGLIGIFCAAPAALGIMMIFGDARRREWSFGRAAFAIGLAALSAQMILHRHRKPDEVATVAALLVIAFVAAGRIMNAFSSSPIEATQPAAPRPPRNVDRALTELRGHDPGFSRVSFLDWVQALYHGLHDQLGTPAERNLAPFIAQQILDDLHRETGPGARLTTIVIGSMTITEVDLESDLAAIVVDIEANYTLERAGTAPVRLVLREAWRLQRRLSATTPPPERMRVLSCPSCGAALAVNELGACTYCGAGLRGGQLQWLVTRRAVVMSESFSTDGLGETVPEEGTDLPTRYARDVTGAANEIALAHGLPDAAAFAAQLASEVVEPVFRQMYAAWSNRRWNDVRHLLTDRLWESQRAWVDAYAQKGLINRLADLRVENVELVRAERDRDYESATVRVFAQCCDYTVDRAGEVIGGDPKRPRRFSEYWVFIRSAQAKAPAAPRAEAKCPNCGAPLDKLGETGVCGYCNAKVTTGDFGWVLSAIVQDEVYRG
jgi:predicted lipid-binding transport protein (Tim44 family)